MNEFKPIPGAVSHKDLNRFLTKAKKDIVSENTINEIADKEFQDLTNQWHKISKELISGLNAKKSYLPKDKGASSLMALGALEVHLNMAIQALKASEKDN